MLRTRRLAVYLRQDFHGAAQLASQDDSAKPAVLVPGVKLAADLEIHADASEFALDLNGQQHARTVVGQAAPRRVRCRVAQLHLRIDRSAPAFQTRVMETPLDPQQRVAEP